MTTPDAQHPSGLNLVHVDDADDPRLLPYTNLRDQWLRARHRPWMTGEPAHGDPTPTGLPGDLFIAEGDKVVAQLVSSPHETLSVMVSEKRLDRHLSFLAGLDADTPVFVVGRQVIDGVAGFPIHRGLLACGRRVDPGPALELAARSGVVIVLEDLANHDNVGAVFRNTRALARPVPGKAHPACVLLTPRCCDPLYRKALRVSMGNALHVPFATIEPWPDAIADLSRAGCEPLAMTLTDDAEDLADLCTAPDRTPMVIMGTEGPGLASKTVDAVRSAWGRAVRIDIEPEADSLNVSVASAVALHRLRERPRER